MKNIKSFILVLMFGTLSACGGGGDGYGGTTTTTADDSGGGGGNNGGGGDNYTGATTMGSMVITAPISNAIIDNKNATYRKKFAVSLSDQGGLPADNSTEITLKVVDTILATGIISGSNPDTASSTNVSIPSAVDTAGNPITDLTTTSIIRYGVTGGTHRNILANDLFILTGAVDSRDVIRTIAANPTISDGLTISSVLNANYPAYDNTDYVVAASMLSTSVAGDDGQGNLTPGRAYPLNNEGVATVWVTYPSDINHIHAGCTDINDPRVAPVGSSQPILIATAGGITRYYPFCLGAIGPYVMTAVPETIIVNDGDSDSTIICVEDGGDGVGIPYEHITSAKQTAGDASVSVTDSTTLYTNGSGCFSLTVNGALATGGASGDTGTVTVTIGNGSNKASLDVIVTVN